MLKKLPLLLLLCGSNTLPGQVSPVKFATKTNNGDTSVTVNALVSYTGVEGTIEIVRPIRYSLPIAKSPKVEYDKRLGAMKIRYTYRMDIESDCATLYIADFFFSAEGYYYVVTIPCEGLQVWGGNKDFSNFIED